MIGFALTLLWIVALLQALLILLIIRELQRLRSGTTAAALGFETGLVVGQSAPAFSAQGVDATKVFRAQPSGQQSVLLFVNSGCGSCRRLIAELAKLSRYETNSIMVACFGPPRRVAALLAKLGPHIAAMVGLDEQEVVNAYRLRRIPAAVQIDSSGAIAGYLYDPQEIVALLEQSVGINAGAVPASSPFALPAHSA